MLTEKELKVLRQIRDKGFAVVLWTPEELGEEVSPDKVEDRLIELGWEVIESLTPIKKKKS